MKDASDLLGISYNIMYGKYREHFGLLSKKSTSQLQTQFTSNDLDSLNIIEYNEYTGTRQEFWEEHYVIILLRVSKHDFTYAFTFSSPFIGLIAYRQFVTGN